MSPYFENSEQSPRNRWRVSRPILKLLLVGLYLLEIAQPQVSLGQANPPTTGKPQPLADQHFVCNTGYSREVCHAQVARLAAVLLRYQSTLPKDWTWVLVRPEDWSRILQGLNLQEESPAFTVLAKRQTFLNEALFRTDARSSAQLLNDFAVPLDHVLEYAIAHELGHAFCGEVRERQASLLAEQLAQTGSMQCRMAPGQPSGPTTRDTVQTLDPPKL